jgi:lysozyme
MLARLMGRVMKAVRSRPKTAGAVGGVGGGVALAAAITIALPMVEHHEGLRTNAYLDPVGIPTICFGETLGVKMGDRKTVQECQDMLAPRLQGFLEEMRACTEAELPAKTEAAFLSFTYNLGSGVYCRNIAGKRINRGKVAEACEAMTLYVKAGNPRRTLRGLVRRRAEERDLCMAGLREGGLL